LIAIVRSLVDLQHKKQELLKIDMYRACTRGSHPLRAYVRAYKRGHPY